MSVLLSSPPLSHLFPLLFSIFSPPCHRCYFVFYFACLGTLEEENFGRLPTKLPFFHFSFLTYYILITLITRITPTLSPIIEYVTAIPHTHTPVSHGLYFFFNFHHHWFGYTKFDYRKELIENVSEILSSCSRKSKLLLCIIDDILRQRNDISSQSIINTVYTGDMSLFFQVIHSRLIFWAAKVEKKLTFAYIYSIDKEYMMGENTVTSMYLGWYIKSIRQYLFCDERSVAQPPTIIQVALKTPRFVSNSFIISLAVKSRTAI
jgi:hypothetical protein